ncbi:MAG: hypothetical protein EWV89_02550 [Microcystis wesenbergii Mw_QC_B_20070930_S4]|nr:MAG: hypothetical protein EWV73_06415 [Microcystis wesenbergii Mw_QC_B_20070930_S4D]TRV17524.1 MAG: hypothetical protein EWV89_02550 [Microcystis wesenbergii Mw_QC_B_20070930_S4]
MATPPRNSTFLSYWDLDKKQIKKSLNPNPRLGLTSRSPKSLKPRYINENHKSRLTPCPVMV